MLGLLQSLNPWAYERRQRRRRRREEHRNRRMMYRGSRSSSRSKGSFWDDITDFFD